MAETREQYEARRLATIEHEKSTGWIEITDIEYNKALSGQAIYNGCSARYLGDLFGHDNVKHVAGINWFRRGTAI